MAFKNYSNTWNDKKDIVPEIIEETPIATPKIGKVFNCEKVYLREAASQESNHVEILDRGTELFVDSVEGHWCKVTTLGNKFGYVMKKFVKIED